MKHSFINKVSALVLCFFILISSFCIPTGKTSAADSKELYKMAFKAGGETIETDGKTVVDNYENVDFEINNDDFSISEINHIGKNSLFIKKDSEDAAWPVTVTGDYDEPIDLSPYNELFFRVFAKSKDNTGKVKIEIKLYANGITYTQSGEFDASGGFDVYCPIGSFENRASVDRIQITVTCPENTDNLIISTLFADDAFSYSHITLFTSDKITSENGITLYEDKIIPTLAEGSADMTAKTTTVPEDCATVSAMVTISGAESGTVTLLTRDGTAEEFSDIATLTLFGGENQYSFLFPASKGTHSYKLLFSGISTAEGESLTVHSTALQYFSETVTEKSDSLPCSISSCTVIEGGSKIRVNGTLRSNAVVNNLGAKLNVYAVDTLWNTESEAVLTASVDITTVFEITFDTAQLKLNPYFYKYFLTIESDGESTIVSPSVYPTAAPANFTTGSSVLGIQSNDPSDAFSTNASHAVVDIDLGKLLITDGKGGRVHSYGGSFRYLSASYVNELDSKINFLNGSAVNVYLRVLWENTEGSEGSVYLMTDAHNFEESLSYMTMIDFLTNRYSGISGIILGSRIDSELYGSGGSSSLISRAKNYVELLRLTSIVARPNAPEAAVFVPFGDGYVYGGDGDGSDYLYDPMTGIGENAAAPVMMSEIISQLISESGAFRWHMLYECESAPWDAMTESYRLSVQLTQGGGTSPSGHMVFWQPEKMITNDEIATLSEAITENAVALGTGAVIISVTKQPVDPRVIFRTIENSSFGETSSRKITEHAGYVLWNNTSGNNLTLWDFTSSFSTEGFIGGGSITLLSTEISSQMAEFEALDTCRCLKVTFDKDSKESGTVMCYFDTPKLLKNATAIDISMNVGSDLSEKIPVKIIFGKGNVRYEYSAELTAGAPSVIRCDTSIIEKDFAAEYIAFYFEPNTVSFTEFTKISALNRSVSNEVLREMLDGSVKNEKTMTKESKLIISGVAFVGATVIVFAMLNIRTSDRKDTDGKKQTKANSDKNSRPNNKQ